METRHPHRHFRQAAASFTISELLVVVAIIAVLVALQRAKNTAKQIACMNHLHQLGTAVLLLGDDNDGWLDSAHLGAVSNWNDAVTIYLGGNAFVKPIGVHQRSLACATVWLNKNGPMWNSAFYMNANRTNSLHQVSRAWETFLLCECSVGNTASSGSIDNTVNGNPVSWIPRHEGRGLNCVFEDGHGEFLVYTSPVSRWQVVDFSIPLAEGRLWYGGSPVIIYGVRNH